MLGAFTDPFLTKNFDATVEIVNFFSIHGNPIHLAVRYTAGKNITRLFEPKSNVVLNYSIASMRNKIELPNQKARFEEAKVLVDLGYNVALFLRPVIKDVTLNDIDEIIEHAKQAGFTVVTIGGLYVDERIMERLRLAGIALDGLSPIKKQFVLDDRKVLRKMKIDDIETITRKFNEAGFTTFTSSDQRIEHYRVQSKPKAVKS